MKYISLENGVQVPQLGLGAWRMKDEKTSIQAVLWALEAGYRHIDTASHYDNEQAIGKAIRQSGINRKDLFITSKVWADDIREGKVREAFEESLRKLDLDYLDLYLLHWPVEHDQQAWQVLEELYQEGKVRAIGISNYLESDIDALLPSVTIKPMINQIESNPYFANQELMDYSKSQGMQVEVYRPIGGFRMSQTLLKEDVLMNLSEKYHKTPAQIVIRWHIQRGVIVFPKSSHQERIQSNFDVFDFELTEEEMNQIHQIHNEEYNVNLKSHQVFEGSNIGI